jgi:hypothetical protein
MKTTGTGEKIDQLLKTGAQLSIALDAGAAGSVFGPNATAPFVTILDANEFGLLLAPTETYLGDDRRQHERQGAAVFVQWRHIYAVRAHPSTANAQG